MATPGQPGGRQQPPRSGKNKIYSHTAPPKPKVTRPTHTTSALPLPPHRAIQRDVEGELPAGGSSSQHNGTATVAPTSSFIEFPASKTNATNHHLLAISSNDRPHQQNSYVNSLSAELSNHSFAFPAPIDEGLLPQALDTEYWDVMQTEMPTDWRSQRELNSLYNGFGTDPLDGYHHEDGAAVQVVAPYQRWSPEQQSTAGDDLAVTHPLLGGGEQVSASTRASEGPRFHPACPPLSTVAQHGSHLLDPANSRPAPAAEITRQTSIPSGTAPFPTTSSARDVVSRHLQKKHVANSRPALDFLQSYSHRARNSEQPKKRKQSPSTKQVSGGGRSKHRRRRSPSPSPKPSKSDDQSSRSDNNTGLDNATYGRIQLSDFPARHRPLVNHALDYYGMKLYTNNPWPSLEDTEMHLKESRNYAEAMVGKDFVDVHLDEEKLQSRDARLRGKIKYNHKSIIRKAYDLQDPVDVTDVDNLLVDQRYAYAVLDPNGPGTVSGSFRQAAIATILKDNVWRPRGSIGAIFLPDIKSMPLELIAFACIVVENGLHEIKNERLSIDAGVSPKAVKMDGEIYAPRWEVLFGHLKAYAETHPARCAELQSSLAKAARSVCLTRRIGPNPQLAGHSTAVPMLFSDP